MAFHAESEKSFDEVVSALEAKTAEHKFRVLHVHDVQATLAEKGLERAPLKIIEVCNASFAHEALQKDVDVSMFMPCKFTVHEDGDRTKVTMARPKMIALMMPEAGLEPLAEQVEITLKKVLDEAI
jgi:uncharacterized protein (DUF302 family)